MKEWQQQPQHRKLAGTEDKSVWERSDFRSLLWHTYGDRSRHSRVRRSFSLLDCAVLSWWMHVQLAANSSLYWGWTSRHDVLISNSAMDTKTCSSVLENVLLQGFFGFKSGPSEISSPLQRMRFLDGAVTRCVLDSAEDWLTTFCGQSSSGTGLDWTKLELIQTGSVWLWKWEMVSVFCELHTLLPGSVVHQLPSLSFAKRLSFT